MATGRYTRYNSAMLTMNLTLTEGLAEVLAFVVTDLQQSPVSVAGINFAAYLQKRGSDEIQVLKTEHSDTKGEILVHIPALSAGGYEWEMWRSSDASSEVFLKGAAECFSVLAVKSIAASEMGKRRFSVATQLSGEAWQVQALPGNASLACLEKIREVYEENLLVERIELDVLPPIDQAQVNAVYYVKGTPWVAVNGNWVAQDVRYDFARPGQPGLLVVNETVPGSEEPGAAELKAANDGNRYLVPPATLDGTQGVVTLSEDFVSHAPETGLIIRRAVPADSRPGLVSVIGTEEEEEDLERVSSEVYSAGKVEKRLTQILSAVADRELSNVADNIDYVVEHNFTGDITQNSWYRLWKSGWLEQGGCTYVKSQDVTIEFTKRYDPRRLYTCEFGMASVNPITIFQANAFYGKMGPSSMIIHTNVTSPDTNNAFLYWKTQGHAL